ncbi:hypothetical protein GOZ78_02605 [Agrobacterium vitis]|uniref:Uncharacterized protein n=1 Tax=Agrobacterium vitis TaxID=373 RepID=A0ABD6G7I7_AGRVI|nr:hypothetical protein [Agrobacterium vitis]MUO77787.1 hypothetical protein [Agrobacterium vitis]MUO93305.1 hypothetical protein [Agrobacterium vitis]MUP04656.1 hypothetical protein [Agrobacterium vitis]MUZ80907.1 hypothetical protein [Agrobacterium vitis]MVA08908.1 hypothetical protein [Agrobacterium vitis]
MLLIVGIKTNAGVFRLYRCSLIIALQGAVAWPNRYAGDGGDMSTVTRD